MLLHAIALITISSVSVDTEEGKVRYSIECSMEEILWQSVKEHLFLVLLRLDVKYYVWGSSSLRERRPTICSV